MPVFNELGITFLPDRHIFRILCSLAITFPRESTMHNALMHSAARRRICFTEMAVQEATVDDQGIDTFEESNFSLTTRLRASVMLSIVLVA